MSAGLQVFVQYFMREVTVLMRQFRLIVNSSLIFLMILLFFPLTMPSDESLLRLMAPGLAWIALLLAFLISSDRLFQQDYEDGVLEQWMVSGQPLSLLVTAKLLSHWIVNILPILLLTPLLTILFNLNFYETTALILSLLLGSPAILFLCALTSVFGGGLRQKGIFMALILLPLTIPVMVFGSGTVTVAMQGMPVHGYLALLLALSVLAMGLLPFAIAAMIRISLVD